MKFEDITLNFNKLYDFGNILYDKDLYNENGKKIRQKKFKVPKDGIFKGYTKNGFLVLEITYQNGKQNGKSVMYHEDTNIISSVNFYKNNKLDGLCKSYRIDGTLQTEEIFKNGVKEGIEKIYNNNGDLVQEAMWINNSIAKVITPKIQASVMDKVETFEYENKIGLRDSITKDVIIKPVYDYDDAIKGSYYVDPEYWDNYYLYRFRDDYIIFKCEEKLCVFNDKGVLIEPLTDDTETIIEKYYYGAKE